jgi:uncharacterized protein
LGYLWQVNERLCIIGASVRAAAASALRAGLRPWCADLFADADLRAMVPEAVRCSFDEYPAALADYLRNAPPGPWMYTGGLENHPDLIGEIAKTRPLWGNGPEALAMSRCPFTVQRLLREAGLPSPELFTGQGGLPNDTRWLRKPRRGSAGQGIAFAAPTLATRSHFCQQFIEGTPMSAVYVRAEDHVTLLGVTEQLIGSDWLHAPPFRYAGNIGPLDLADEVRDDLVQTGEALGAGCGLLGLFGVDFMLANGRSWVVEVNPRYTASIEVLERAMGLCAFAHHRQAFEPHVAEVSLGVQRGFVGKAILYAPRHLVMPAIEDLPGGILADIPSLGEIIEPGWPILTCFSESSTPDACRSELRDLVARILDAIEPCLGSDVSLPNQPDR